MANLKDKVEQAGHRISEKATEVGHKVGEGVEKAADWAKEKSHEVGNRLGEAKDKVVNRMQEGFGTGNADANSISNVHEHMDVLGSCGNKLGVVDHVEGDRIKLTKDDSPDGQHHFLPSTWIARVDEQVHLSKNCGEAAREWQAA
jgi:hypothetical protein